MARSDLGSPLRPLIGQHGDVVSSNRPTAALQDVRAPRGQRGLPLARTASLIDRRNALMLPPPNANSRSAIAAEAAPASYVTAVRRKSWNRQPANIRAGSRARPHLRPACLAKPARRSCRSLNTKSWLTMRGTLARIARAGSGDARHEPGVLCRAAGNVQVVRSADTSLHRSPQLPSRRQQSAAATAQWPKGQAHDRMPARGVDFGIDSTDHAPGWRPDRRQS